MLDWVGDKQAAASLADTVYRHGGPGGMELIQEAINKVAGDKVVKVDGGMGSKTFNEFQRLVHNPATRARLLSTIADLRDKAEKRRETDRTGHYRPRK